MTATTAETLTIHPRFTAAPDPTPTPEQQAAHIAGLLRALYRTNDGPRLIAEVMREFPHPRKVWNGADGRKCDRWGMPATDYAAGR